MTTDVFPTLAGLGWDAKKSPRLSTRIATSVGGKEIRSPQQALPRWAFSLSYPVLRNRPSADDLGNILGFFLNHNGPADTWMFQDPSDYQLSTQVLGTGDGTTKDFTFTRQLGSADGCVYREPVGQVDTVSAVSYLPTAIDTTTNIISAPQHGRRSGDGPFLSVSTGTQPGGLSGSTFYWVYCPTPNTLGLATSQDDALAGTLVNISDQGTGSLSIVRTALAYVGGVAQTKSAFNVIGSNTLRFSAAPTLGSAVTADFAFFYVCRFLDDELDPTNFADKLWELGKCDFISVLS